MGNAFSRDGAVTKFVESLPGGGWLTAPFHAAAGNPVHAAQAAIAGFTSVGGALVGGPAGIIVGNATGAGLSGIFTELGLDDNKKVEAVGLLRCGKPERAAKVLLQAGEEKIAESTKKLSAESGGRRSLKSVHGTWLRAVEPDWKVDMVQGKAREWEHWYIEDWGAKVVLKARGGPNMPGQFLRAHPGGAVDLVAHPKKWEMWKPFKNGDGSWSFLNAHGSWLSARKDGSVRTVKKCDSWEQFWLEWW